MKCCSFLSASLENRWADLVNFFLTIPVIIRIGFLGKEKFEELPRKLENREQLNVLFYGIFV